MNLLPYVPVMVLTTVITGFSGVIVAIVKVWPRLKELSNTKMEEAITAWQAIAKRHEERIAILEKDNGNLRQEIRSSEDQCRADIKALRKQMDQLQESTMFVLGRNAPAPKMPPTEENV